MLGCLFGPHRTVSPGCKWRGGVLAARLQRESTETCVPRMNPTLSWTRQAFRKALARPKTAASTACPTVPARRAARSQQPSRAWLKACNSRGGGGEPSQTLKRGLYNRREQSRAESRSSGSALLHSAPLLRSDQVLCIRPASQVHSGGLSRSRSLTFRQPSFPVRPCAGPGALRGGREGERKGPVMI